MKQRLGIACALLGNPKLILLDEPTNGLDPAGIQEIRQLICRLPKQYGMTVLVSSHLLSEIDQMAAEIGIIDHGELLFENSLHAYRTPTAREVCTSAHLRTETRACPVKGEACSGITFHLLGRIAEILSFLCQCFPTLSFPAFYTH